MPRGVGNYNTGTKQKMKKNKKKPASTPKEPTDVVHATLPHTGNGYMEALSGQQYRGVFL